MRRSFTWTCLALCMAAIMAATASATTLDDILKRKKVLIDKTRAAVQERMFRDEEYFARIRLAELDLIDACAAGWLPADVMEPARRFLAESTQPFAAPAAGGLAAALRHLENGQAEKGLLERLLGR